MQTAHVQINAFPAQIQMTEGLKYGQLEISPSMYSRKQLITSNANMQQSPSHITLSPLQSKTQEVGTQSHWVLSVN